MRIYPALAADHPSVGDNCWICVRPICAGQRTTLKACETPDEVGSLSVEAKLCHATCVVRGLEVATPKGRRIIERIKDGDASPYPVETTDGQQWTLEEVGLRP